MSKKIDLNTIAKEYAEGRISKEDFLYLHKMLSTKAQAKTGTQAPPVLHNTANNVAPQTKRRSVRPNAVARPTHQQANARKSAHGMQSPFGVPEKKAGLFSYIRNHHKEVVALLGTLGLFISMFYNKMDFTPPGEGNTRVVMVTESNEQHSPRIRTQDIKLIAQLMMEDNSWNTELIDDFKHQWNKLTDNERSRIKKTDWYFDFSSMLSQQIKTSRTKAKTGDVTSIYNQQALLSLADTLIFGNSKKAEEMLANISQKNSPASARQAPESKANATSGNVVKKEVSPVAKTRDADNKTRLATIEKATNGRPSAPLKRHRISRREIEDIINRFTVAFEAGHTRELTDLFASKDYSSSFTTLNGIKLEYRELFRNTRDRQLDFDSFFWEHDFDEARGTAKYLARVRMLDDNINKTIEADVDITLRRLQGKILITHFQLQDKRVVANSKQSGSKQSTPVSRSKTVTSKVAVNHKDKPKYPTPAELQDLVTQYVTAYEMGDVNDLMKLFANATWTSSRTGLVEMKQNYKDLFSTTSDREVFIKNVKWEIKGDKALGTGELLLTLHDDDERVETKKGKIRIVAQKSKDLVRFTQMFHILN